MSAALRINEMLVTPVACPDPPLLNHHGVHEPYFLRAIVRLRTELATMWDSGLDRLKQTAEATHRKGRRQ